MRRACAAYIRWRMWEHFWLTSAQSKDLAALQAEAPHDRVGDSLNYTTALYKTMLAKTLCLFATEQNDDEAWRYGTPQHIAIRNSASLEWQVWDYKNFHQRHVTRKDKAESLVPKERFAAPLDAGDFVRVAEAVGLTYVGAWYNCSGHHAAFVPVQTELPNHPSDIPAIARHVLAVPTASVRR